MRTFEYRGYDGAGRAVKGLIEGADARDARERLAAGGVLAERVEPTRRRGRLTVEARTTLYRELATLLAAGVPLLRALETVLESAETGEERVAVAMARDGVRDGLSLAEALGAASGAVTDFERAIIEAAERSGGMDTLLARLAEFMEQQEALRQRASAALVYPLIVLAVGICAAMVMLGVLLPRTGALLEGTRAGVPALTRLFLAVGHATARWWWLFLVLAAGAGWGGRRLWAARPGWRLAAARAAFGVPGLGRGLRLLTAMRFSQTLAVLLRGGISPVQGVALAGRATGNAWVRLLAEGEAEAIRHGARLSDALGRIPPLADSLSGWVRVGESSGGLDALLERAGRRMQDRWERFVGQAMSMLEPLLILLIGAFVLLVTLAVLLPVLSLTQALGG